MVVAVMAFAGFTAGLLGIGGALIFNPVLLQLGVQPQVRSASRSLRACKSVDAYTLGKFWRLFEDIHLKSGVSYTRRVCLQ